ncbi:MAG TPA: hypothetical protein VFQ61_21020, partial [Polyangiaceae bacterium]|nr:hypothetical protein [Polyangiaceae bacterium]
MGASEHVPGSTHQRAGADPQSSECCEGSVFQSYREQKPEKQNSGQQSSLLGIFGRPYVDLEPHLDLTGLADLHDEICLGLTQVAVDYTGGSHRTLGIVPPSLPDPSFADY